MTQADPKPQRWNWASFVDSLNPSMLVGLLLPDGTVVHANQTALDLVGVPLAEVAGLPIERTPWWRHSEAARGQLRAALEAGRRGEASRFEFELLAADGRLVALDFSLRPVLQADGTVGFLVPSGCDISDRRLAQQRSLQAAEHDALTGLLNRHGLTRRLPALLQEAASQGRAVAALAVDLDVFDRINRALGSEAGDAVLAGVAERMAGWLGGRGLAARVDGDEFALVLVHDAGDPSPDWAERACAQLQALLARGLRAGAHEVFVTSSVGFALAEAGEDGAGADVLLRRAALALDRAKRRGRHACVRYERERGESDPQRFALESALRGAAQRGELALLYQPQVSIASGEIVAVEALLRWRHPRLGEIEPARFVPIAEEAGLMGEIGDWVLDTACATAAAWQHEGLMPVRMMVNVSALQLRGGDFDRRIERALARSGLEPCRLGIELTESVMMEQLDAASLQLARLRALGIEVALDDFGTGYSSLGYLRRLPLDVVKIDRSLVPAVAGDSDALPIVRAVVAMAHSLGLRVVAEGVESEAQLELMAANHCDDFQGFHFSGAVPAEDMHRMLHAGRRLAQPERRRAQRVRNVLVVDDDPRVLARLRALLPLRFGEQLRTETFADPQAALEHLRSAPVDIVVCDLLMPALDGIAFMGHARELQPEAVRMMLLGEADLARVIDDERQVDVFRYLSKPWSAEQLFKHFEAALEKVDRTRAERVLMDDLRSPQPQSAPALELLQLEDVDPGITAVQRGPLDEVELPSRLLTMPGDLWVSSKGSFSRR